MVLESAKKVDDWYEVTIKDPAGNSLVGYVNGDLVEVRGEARARGAGRRAEAPARRRQA